MGPRAIGEVEAGERVWAYDFVQQQWRLCLVTCRHDAEYAGRLVTLVVEGQAVEATAFHPFWVSSGEGLEDRPAVCRAEALEGSAGPLAGRWVYSQDVRAGDMVFLREGRLAAVESVSLREVRMRVCNLTVADLHTFAVGAAAVLVHNTSNSLEELLKTTKEALEDLNKNQASMSAEEFAAEKARLEGEVGRIEQQIKAASTPKILESERLQAEADQALNSGDVDRAIELEDQAAKARIREAEEHAQQQRQRVAQEQAEKQLQAQQRAQERAARIREQVLQGREVREAAQQRASALLQETRKAGELGQTSGRSGTAGAPRRRAAAALEREANEFPRELDDLKQAYKTEAERLRQQADADDHKTSR